MDPWLVIDAPEVQGLLFSHETGTNTHRRFRDLLKLTHERYLAAVFSEAEVPDEDLWILENNALLIVNYCTRDTSPLDSSQSADALALAAYIFELLAKICERKAQPEEAFLHWLNASLSNAIARFEANSTVIARKLTGDPT